MRRESVKRFADSAKALLLTEFVSAFWLAMKYFVRPKATINYPFERGAISRSQRSPLASSRFLS